jgi:hypothetical protein
MLDPGAAKRRERRGSDRPSTINMLVSRQAPKRTSDPARSSKPPDEGTLRAAWGNFVVQTSILVSTIPSVDCSRQMNQKDTFPSVSKLIVLNLSRYMYLDAFVI